MADPTPDEVDALFADIVAGDVDLEPEAPMCECRCATGQLIRHADRDCARYAQKLARLHLVGECDTGATDPMAPSIDPDGNVVVYLCARCADAVMAGFRRQVLTTLAKMPEGAVAACPTCHRPLGRAEDYCTLEDLPR